MKLDKSSSRHKFIHLFPIIIYYHFKCTGTTALSFNYSEHRIEVTKSSLRWCRAGFILSIIGGIVYLRYVIMIIEQGEEVLVVKFSMYSPFVGIYLVLLCIFEIELRKHHHMSAIMNELWELTDKLTPGEDNSYFYLHVAAKFIHHFCAILIGYFFLFSQLTDYNDKRYWYVTICSVNMELLYESSASLFYLQMTAMTQLYLNLSKRLTRCFLLLSLTRKGNKVNVNVSCSISDEIDKIVTLHRRLHMVNLGLSHLYEWLILISMSSGFCLMLINIYASYQTFGTVQFDLNSFLFSIAGFANFFILQNVCTDLTTSSNSTANISDLALCPYEIDERLNRTIEMASFALLFNTARIKILGMYCISLKLFIPFFATMASYLLILIQFTEYK